MSDLTQDEFERLKFIAWRGPIINMMREPVDQTLFDRGLIVADRTAVYASRQGLRVLFEEPFIREYPSSGSLNGGSGAGSFANDPTSGSQ